MTEISRYTFHCLLMLRVSCCFLSVISLATRCAMPSFRMHLRARGKVAQVFKTLNDAPQHPVRISQFRQTHTLTLLPG